MTGKHIQYCPPVEDIELYMNIVNKQTDFSIDIAHNNNLYELKCTFVYFEKIKNKAYFELYPLICWQLLDK